MSTTPRTELFPGPRITTVTVARLHNLGNYEHIRYECTVALPEGTSPASVIGELEQLMDELQPRPPVNNYELLRARQRLAEPAVPDDPYDPKRRAEARDQIALHEAYRREREKALDKFNQFGGLTRIGQARRPEDRDADGGY